MTAAPPVSTALGVEWPGAPFRRTEVEDEPLAPRHVRIAIEFCGICHTDVHLASGEWPGGLFPMVPGHEIAGRVTAVGAAVDAFVVGDRVGVSTYVDSCRRCRRCTEGLEQYCEEGEVLTYNSCRDDGSVTVGGYRTSMSVDEHFVIAVPPEVELQHAGPLMCAGTTVWSVLRTWGVGPGSRVGVVGLGGLGHLAVKLARSLGAEVTVIGRSRAKAADAVRFGATGHLVIDQVVTGDVEPCLDLVINTVGQPLDLDRLIDVLDQDGTWVDVGVPTRPRSIDFQAFARGRRRYAASKIGSPDDMRTMLAHVAASGVRPEITVISGAELDAAFADLTSGSAPYRYVLDISTLGEDPS